LFRKNYQKTLRGKFFGAPCTVNARIQYGNSAHVGHGCRQQRCIQNCGQTASWLLLTGYSKLPWHYLTVPFPTSQYMLYGQAVDISYPRLNRTVGQKFVIKLSLQIPPHLKCVTALPCEMSVS